MLDRTIIAMDAYTSASAALCVTTSERLSCTDLWLPTAPLLAEQQRRILRTRYSVQAYKQKISRCLGPVTTVTH